METCRREAWSNSRAEYLACAGASVDNLEDRYVAFTRVIYEVNDK